MGTIALIVALFIGGLLLLAAEVCTPSFGILAVSAVACLAGMVYVCFGVDRTLGVTVVALLIFVVPAYLWAMIRYLPQTPLGRVLQLRADRKSPGEGTPEAETQQALVGRTAVAETPLRPSGAIRVDRKRIIATAEAGFIDKGATVRIVKAAGANVVVRELTDQA